LYNLHLYNDKHAANKPQPAKLPDQPVINTTPQVPLADNKLNIVVYGLPENPPNTNWEDRLQRDVEKNFD